jgi:hypothetical protein
MQKFRGDDPDIKFKPLTHFRREGSYQDGDKIVKGKLVQEELDYPEPFDGEDAMDTLLAGINSYEIEEGRATLAVEHPELASQQMHDFMDEAADSLNFEDGNRFDEPKRVASVKRLGMLFDAETGDTINFRRIKGTGQVELSSEDGEVIDTLASSEFDELLDTGTYRVL